ncbi:unnamed protein product [Heligmosomoides polygyrus]|uniref:Uncharacterized protein n=1 Tax=Heligmosomoides polygyrus TaxID=6339 RepID=A0A183FHE4_HELPZ|nr:unnamed protein product [Heligmosomoides polygyrus]
MGTSVEGGESATTLGKAWDSGGPATKAAGAPSGFPPQGRGVGRASNEAAETEARISYKAAEATAHEAPKP